MVCCVSCTVREVQLHHVSLCAGVLLLWLCIRKQRLIPVLSLLRLVSTERHSSVRYSTVRFGKVLQRLACTSSANRTLTWWTVLCCHVVLCTLRVLCHFFCPGEKVSDFTCINQQKFIRIVCRFLGSNCY